MEQNDLYIVKRDGKKVPFSLDKIKNAIRAAFLSTGSYATEDIVTSILSRVSISQGMSVEEIQNQVEMSLMVEKYYTVAKHYMLYRQQHTGRGGGFRIIHSDGNWHFFAFYSKSGESQYICLDTTDQTNTLQSAFYTGSKTDGVIGARDTGADYPFVGNAAQLRFLFGADLAMNTFRKYCAAYKAEFTPPVSA